MLTENILDLGGSIVASLRFDNTQSDPNGLYAGQYYFYNADARGSTTAIIKPDGTLTTGYSYDEFGQKTQSGASDFLNEVTFTGSVSDTSSGLQYMNARFYQPSTGRFISQDSYTGSANEPWTQHLYSYCGNNPVNMVDPTGHRAMNVDGDNVSDIGYLKPNMKPSIAPKETTQPVDTDIQIGDYIEELMYDMDPTLSGAQIIYPDLIKLTVLDQGINILASSYLCYEDIQNIINDPGINIINILEVGKNPNNPKIIMLHSSKMTDNMPEYIEVCKQSYKNMTALYGNYPGMIDVRGRTWDELAPKEQEKLLEMQIIWGYDLHEELIINGEKSVFNLASSLEDFGLGLNYED